MIKLNLTSELIDFVKNERLSKNVNASEFAKRISKTNAYVSKFEKGDFKNIDLDDLYFYIGCIYSDPDEVVPVDTAIDLGKPIVSKFLDEYIVNNKDESNDFYRNDEGLQTYDETLKIINIPSELVDYLNNRINKENLDIDMVIEHCNKNEDADEQITKNSKYEYNTYYKTEEGLTIKFQLQLNEFNNILLKKQEQCSFITIFMILYTINRLSKKPTIPDKAAIELTYQTLDKFHFFSLKMIRDRKKVEDIKTDALKKLESFPIDTIYVVSQLINIFYSYSSLDLNYTIHKTQNILNNMFTDPSLLFSLIELSLEPVKDLNISKKRELLDDIEKLIESYSKQKTDNINVNVELL